MSSLTLNPQSAAIAAECFKDLGMAGGAAATGAEATFIGAATYSGAAAIPTAAFAAYYAGLYTGSYVRYTPQQTTNSYPTNTHFPSQPVSFPTSTSIPVSPPISFPPVLPNIPTGVLVGALLILETARGRQNIRNDYLDALRRANPRKSKAELCALLEAAYEEARNAKNTGLAQTIKLAQKALGCRQTHYGNKKKLREACGIAFMHYTISNI